MKLKDFLDLYDNWNGTLVINTVKEDGWKRIYKGNISKFVDNFANTVLMDYPVVSFGFYDNELCVRV